MMQFIRLLLTFIWIPTTGQIGIFNRSMLFVSCPSTIDGANSSLVLLIRQYTLYHAPTTLMHKRHGKFPSVLRVRTCVTQKNWKVSVLNGYHRGLELYLYSYIITIIFICSLIVLRNVNTEVSYEIKPKLSHKKWLCSPQWDCCKL